MVATLLSLLGGAEAQEQEQANSVWSFQKVWTLTGNGLTGAGSGDLLGDASEELLLLRDGTLEAINNQGKSVARLPLGGEHSTLEVGRTANGRVLLAYSNWGGQVDVFDAKGTKLWSYPTPTGVNGAHWGDLDGDGNDEMVVGFNGGGGLHAVDTLGKKLWSTSLGNVWNQSVIPAGKSRQAHIFVTEAGGRVLEFDSKGKLVRDLTGGAGYSSTMRATRVRSGGGLQVICAQKSYSKTSPGTSVICMARDGKLLWKVPIKEDNAGWRLVSFAVGDLDGDGVEEWAFFVQDDRLAVISAKGDRLATLEVDKAVPFIMTAGKGVPGRLVLVRKRGVEAFQLTPRDSRLGN